MQPDHDPTTPLWFIFQEDKLLFNQQSIPEIPHPDELDIKISNQHFLGTFKQKPYYCAELQESSHLPEHYNLQPLKPCYQQLGDELFTHAGRALHILHWDKTHQFCGRCGKPTELMQQERAKQCLACQAIYYPRLSPAVIVLIYREDEMLLARASRFPTNVYSTLAGFIEPGETAEQALSREIMEEIGISVKNIQYFGSQPWPFPDSFMLGYLAEYETGEIKIDPVEIEDAKWFNKNNLPKLPSHASIARKMIENFLSRDKT